MSGRAGIDADIKRCASVRQCVAVAPEYFSPNGEGGRVRILQSSVPPEDFDLVDEAVESCPMQVLGLHPAAPDSAS